MSFNFKVFILLILAAYTSKAQTWELGVTVGGLGYNGDLNQKNFLQINKAGYGFNVKRNFDAYWSLKLGFLKGKVSDDESKSKYQFERTRNLSFFTPINEGHLMLEFNFFDYGFGDRQTNFTPFLFAGVALTMFNPKTMFNGQEYELKYYNTEGQTEYKTTTYSVPFGAGVKYHFGNYFNVIGEIGYRNLNTDYLDDVSGLYPTASQLQETNPNTTAARLALSDRSINKMAVPGSQRGDFRKKDSYVFVGITLSYTFVSQNCYY
jgi:hypothetical protein